MNDNYSILESFVCLSCANYIVNSLRTFNFFCKVYFIAVTDCSFFYNNHNIYIAKVYLQVDTIAYYIPAVKYMISTWNQVIDND